MPYLSKEATSFLPSTFAHKPLWVSVILFFSPWSDTLFQGCTETPVMMQFINCDLVWLMWVKSLQVVTPLLSHSRDCVGHALCRSSSFPFNCEESDILFPSECAIDRPSILGLFDSLRPQVYELLHLFTDFIRQLMFTHSLIIVMVFTSVSECFIQFGYTFARDNLISVNLYPTNVENWVSS
jgi:hypothetical protein